MRGVLAPAEPFLVDVAGAQLAGERRGHGAPLTLIHGMAGDRREWDSLFDMLPTDLPTLRYDLRGFGRSPRREGEVYSHADDLLSLLNALGIERAPLLGLSMGGGVALNFALSHPERVSRLVLISPAMVGWEWSHEWRELWRCIAGAACAGDMADARERWFQHPMFAATRETGHAGALRAAIAAYHGRQWVHDQQRDELPDMDRLHTLACPTLLLTGQRDAADLRLIADVIEAAAPSVTRIDYAGAGHMLHLERTEEVASAILA